MNEDMQTNQSDQWVECEPGDLVHKARSVHRSRRNRRVVVFGAFAMTLFAAGALRLATQTNAPSYDRNDGGILCSELRRQLPAYRDGSLDTQTRDRINEHLQTCPFCDSYVFKPSGKTQPQAALAAERRRMWRTPNPISDASPIAIEDGSGTSAAVNVIRNSGVVEEIREGSNT